MFIVITVTVLALISSAAYSIKKLITPLQTKEDEKALYYKSLVEHGVSLSEALLRAKHLPMEQTVDMYKALKSWEKKTKFVSQKPDLEGFNPKDFLKS